MKDNIFNLSLGDKKIEAHFRNLAEQANGSFLVRLGDTVVHAVCVMAKQDKENLDFFPLTVEYEEKYYAAGKIKGPRDIKRESRPSDEAICNARLIDRSIRPLFPDNLSREIQVVATVLSWDGENDPDVISLLSSSLALACSDIPWNGPVAAVRVARKEDQLIINPTYAQRENSNLDVVFAGVFRNGEFLVNMIEGGFSEVDNDAVLEAFAFAQDHLKNMIEFQQEIRNKIGKTKLEITAVYDGALEGSLRTFIEPRLENALYEKDKEKRSDGIMIALQETETMVKQDHPDDSGKLKYAKNFFWKEVDRIIHRNIIEKGKRPDGRGVDEIRELLGEVGLLPRTHGSALFTRGQTKSLSILTLGSPGDQQLIEGMEIAGKKRFMHHYNFPPYSSGEIKPMRGPGRREIGHGVLAEKALLPLIPSSEEFPYTIRIVTEILSSNGSTSMASVTSSSLALMDAGVPIKRAATGISMGLVFDAQTKEYKILTDIQGPEDHHGDMDFKVAGTREGITAIQLDVKIEGITSAIIKETLEKAQQVRFKILDVMEKVISQPRPSLSSYAPRIITITINPEKIKDVIGPGGKVINEIVAKTGAAIDIEQTGQIFITGENEEQAQKAAEWIKNLTREVEAGETFDGTVTRILNFGAFVEILPGQEGMIHISKLSNQRVNRVEDVVNTGDKVSVKVIEVDDLGRINLTLLNKLPKE